MKRNNGLIGTLATTTNTSASGIVEIFEQYNYKLSNNWPLYISVNSITPTASVYENSVIPINVITTGLVQSMTLYWTISYITATAGDFITTSGSFTQGSNNTGTFNLSTSFIGNLAKSDKTFKIQIRLNSTAGPVLGESNTLLIPAISINTLAFSSSTINEGISTVLNIKLNNYGNAANNTFTLNYSGSAISADINSFVSSVSISGSTLSTVTYNAINDFLTEGAETLTISLMYNTYQLGNITLNINDISLTPTVTITPSSLNVNEGDTLTFTISTNNSESGILFYTLNTVSGTTLLSNRFADGLLSGSVNIVNGTGTITKTLSINGITDNTVFTLSIRNVSISGNILATSSNITITDIAFTNSTYITGTRLPVLGTGGSNPFPATGWTSIVTASADDASVNINLGFNFNFNGVTYTSCYLGSNSYITFGAGSSVYSGLSVSNPALPKIMFGSADNSYQRCSYINTTRYTRIRYEGTASTGGTLGSPNIVAEITFFNPANTINGLNMIELCIGQHNRTNGIATIATSSIALASYTLSTMQSYIFISTDTTGTGWTVYTGYQSTETY